MTRCMETASDPHDPPLVVVVTAGAGRALPPPYAVMRDHLLADLARGVGIPDRLLRQLCERDMARIRAWPDSTYARTPDRRAQARERKEAMRLYTTPRPRRR